MKVLMASERGRFFRFAMVGTVGALVDFGVLNLLTIVFRIPALPSSMFSFVAAVTSNFFWNRHWTYRDSRSKPVSQQLVQFFFVSIIGLAIRTPLFALFEHIMANVFNQMRTPIPAGILAHNAALAMVIGIVLFWNFFANRFWTYNDV